MISIVIPTLNESSHIERTLERIQELSGNFEIIIVDGGSTDATIDLIENIPNVRLYQSKKGRSHQMNKGAAMAKGDVLLFLHADTLLPKGAFSYIQEALEDPEAISGSFYLIQDKPHWIFSMYEEWSKINHSLFTYGDQGIFVRTSHFQDIGGFKPIPLMEDIEIQWRLRKRGKFIKLPLGVVTSARRFLRNGPVKQFMVDVALILLYRAGVSPFWLKKYYRDYL